MPNLIAYAALAIWPVISGVIFARLTAGRALLASFILAYLFLPPPPAGVDPPLLPPFTKETIPSLLAILYCVIFHRERLQIMPQSPTARALLLIFIFCPIPTVLTNSDPQVFGNFYLPGLTFREGVAQAINQALLVAPMLLARNFLGDAKGVRDLLWALFLAGLVYSLPMLLEIRLSPQLNLWVYGYYQHIFEQAMRAGGFRPLVFLYHGLWAAFLLLTAILAGLAIARSETGRNLVLWFAGAFYLFGVLVLAKSLGALLFALMLVPVILLTGAKWQMRLALIMAFLTVAYPVMKATGLVPEDELLAYAARIDETRAASLEFRLDNENSLMDHALTRPAFGWGSWGRNHLYDSLTGERLSTTDGRWIITLGVYGWVGFLAEFGLLFLPVWLVWRGGGALGAALPYWLSGAALIHGINMVDMLPNATLTTMTWLMAGALLGYGEKMGADMPDQAGPQVPTRAGRRKLKTIL